MVTCDCPLYDSTVSSVTAGRLATLGVAVTLVVLATGMSGPVASPPKITGKLSRGGYTVIALAAGGTANSVKAKRGTFSLVPPATAVTLHLRAANGRYAGPIVIGGHGKQVVVGVKAGA